MMDLHIFYVPHSLVQICSLEAKVMPQRDGNLHMEVASLGKDARFCTLSVMPSNEVSWFVFCWDILRYIRRGSISAKNGSRSLVCIHIPDADAVSSPDFQDWFFLRLYTINGTGFQVGKSYLLKPHRCYLCLNFSHVSYSCCHLQNDLPSICVSCDGAGNGGDCPGPVWYYHCCGAHPASLIKCDSLKFQHKIVLGHIQEKFSLWEPSK